MAEFDLTTRMGQYLDRHLVFPLLEFLSVKELYDEKEMLKGKLDLLSNTNMVDFAMDVHKTLYPDQEVPATFIAKRTNVFKEAMVDTLYNYAKFQYECGNYSAAAEYLYFVRILLPPNDRNYLNALWGKLASEILMQNWETALEDLNRLKEVIEANTFGSALLSLQQRTWLIHWSLFVFFNHPKGRDLIIDMFLYSQLYLNAIQTMCPHILRYLTTAVITNKSRRRTVLKDLVKVIQQDPITEFVECLYVHFDFDGAQKKLRECENVLVNDFFLVACLDDFIENARLLIFETFCRIHECISINMLASKLNMTPEDAERWIVNLIRNARLDAKIDSKLGHVVMGTQAVSPYQQVIEKTKNLAFRSQVLAMNIEKKINAKSTEVPQWGAQE
ncbi:EI3EB-like protein [Mya arenaria]|uniref:Eukaryotic translation initiation factor 3 subunit E n=1 Tax=Mya arenaria TaxID=6604 RepID=A0ABY7FSS9_MYAAR|nr:EI3EB-like protein [Mya arenaria]